MSDESKIAIAGKGGVLAAGSLPVTPLELNDGILELMTAEDLDNPDQVPTFVVKYPDGFLKSHQVKDAAELLTQIQNQLRGRNGVNSFEVEGAIKLELGATFKIKEVK